MARTYSTQKQLLQIAVVALLLIGCIAVLTPFIGTLLLASVISVTAAPLRDWLLELCRGRRNLMATLMCLMLILLLVLHLVINVGLRRLIAHDPERPELEAGYLS